MSSFLSPKAEVHTISSDEEFLDSQGQEVFARQQPQSPPSLPAPPHKDEIYFTDNMKFGDSQTVDCLKYQLFLKNIRFKEEDKMKGKEYKQYLLGLFQDEISQGGWSDPVSDEMLNGGVNVTTLGLSNLETFQSLTFKLSKSQTFELETRRTFELSISTRFKPANFANFQSFELSNFQTLNLSNFRSLKLSNLRT